jgi:hypothetical protein
MDAQACDAKKSRSSKQFSLKKYIELHSTNFAFSFKSCINCQIKDNPTLLLYPF